MLPANELPTDVQHRIDHFINDRISQSRLAGLTSNLFERPEALRQRNHRAFLFGFGLSG